MSESVDTAAARAEVERLDKEQRKTNWDILNLILKDTNTTIEEADAGPGTPFDCLRRMIHERNDLRAEVNRLTDGRG